MPRGASTAVTVISPGAPLLTTTVPVPPGFNSNDVLSSVTCLKRKSGEAAIWSGEGIAGVAPVAAVFGSGPAVIFPNGVRVRASGSTHQTHLPSSNFQALGTGTLKTWFPNAGL